MVKAIFSNPTLTELQSKRNRGEDERSAGPAVRADAELPEPGGSDQVEGRLTQVVQEDRQLQGEKPVLFGASEWPHL